jgi:hypothetical protein
MGKLRKKLKKQVNPQKTNRLIITVGIGVIIVFSALFFLLMGPSTPSNKAEAMKDALEYLDKSEGILAVKTFPEENRVVIIYDSFKKKKRDFVKIARYAGLKVSNKVGTEEITMVLAEDMEDQAIYQFVLKGGKLVEESPAQE